nr:MAG TPA: hypothetical protein [Caudoviricetes sp.]
MWLTLLIGILGWIVFSFLYFFSLICFSLKHTRQTLNIMT